MTGRAPKSFVRHRKQLRRLLSYADYRYRDDPQAGADVAALTFAVAVLDELEQRGAARNVAEAALRRRVGRGDANDLVRPRVFTAGRVRDFAERCDDERVAAAARELADALARSEQAYSLQTIRKTV